MKVIFVVGPIWIKRHSLAQSGHLSWTSWGNMPSSACYIKG